MLNQNSSADPFKRIRCPNPEIREHYEIEEFAAGHMKETAKVPAQTDRVASPDEVRQAISSLTEGELFKLHRLAEGAVYRLRRKVWGIGSDDLLQEAMFRLLQEKRRWKPQNVDLVGLLAGIIASIESDWRKRGKRGETPVLESDLSTTDPDGETIPSALQMAADCRPNPEQHLVAGDELTQEELFQQIEEIFSDDPLAALIFSEWQRETTGPEIMKALDLSRQQYDTAVRRMDRAIQKRWPEGMPHVL
jgi:DNA-directed RNA polymerase specialized sigma24 family protein